MSKKGTKPSPKTIDASIKARKGKPLSAEHKKKIGDGVRGIYKNKEWRAKLSKAKTGQKHKPESLIKISLNNKAGLPENREKNRQAHLGKKQPQSQKDKSREITTKLWQNINYRNKIWMGWIWNGQLRLTKEQHAKAMEKNKGDNHWTHKKPYPESAKDKLRIARLGQVFPVKNSDLEKTVQNWLLEENIPFHTHTRIYSQPDIFVTPNIVIQVDGCWWHPCLECHPDFYISERGVNKRISDDKKNKFLIKHGYKLYRIKGHLILNEPESTKKQLIAFISRYMVVFNGT